MPKLIMLIDDDEDDVLFFMDALQEIDPSLRLMTASNGEEALRTLLAPNAPVPDYIFLDMNMPLVNGRECLIRIRQSDSLSSVPVIIYSTSSGRTEAAGLVSLGASYYLTKPFRFSEMVKSIRFILSGEWLGRN
jgi:DNA-binding response OmpR family regulator